MDTRLYDNLLGKTPGYIAPFVWIHGEEKKTLAERIEVIAACGIDTICLESRVHEGFCTKSWFSDVQFIIDCLKQKGMKLWILDDKRCPSGYANGAFETGYAALRPSGITESHIDAIGPITDAAILITPHKNEPTDKLVGVLACRRDGDDLSSYCEVIDITDSVCGDFVYCSLPEGIWRIVVISRTRKGMTALAERCCDKLNPEATQVYIEEVYEKHYAALRDEFGKTFLGFFSDEPGFFNEVNERFATGMGLPFASYPYHSSVYTLLKERYGETLNCRLPGLWLDFKDGSHAEIRTAYMDVITHLYQTCFSDKLGDWCRAHNVRLIGHVVEDNNVHMQTGYGAGHYFRAVSGQDMGGVDVVFHQLLPGFDAASHRVAASSGAADYKNKGVKHHVNADFFTYTLAKLGASAAQLDEKKNGMALCELFGAYGWAESMKTMKWQADHMLVRGINYFVPHAFTLQKNDTDCPPHFYADGKNPHYPYLEPLMAYINRCAHLLSGGAAAIRCGILYDAESGWTAEQSLRTEDVAKQLAQQQVDYHIIPFDAIKTAAVCDGQYRIGRGTYTALLIPHRSYLPQSMADCFVRLAESGVLVLFVGGSPKQTDGDAEFIKQHPQLPFVPLAEIGGFMQARGYADVTPEMETTHLRSYHYRRDGSDIYMLVNEGIHATIDTTVSLRGCEDGYTVYDPMQNKAKSGIGAVRLVLPPYHAVFVVSGRADCDLPMLKSGISLRKLQEINGTFTISLAADCGAYRPYCETEHLFNINGQTHLPHFAGFARYETKFVCPSFHSRLWLDLGRVGEIAEVIVNGRSVGCQIVPPYRFDITEHVSQGTNRLTVVTAAHRGYAERDGFSAYMVFEPTGLLGPVTLCEEI